MTSSDTTSKAPVRTAVVVLLVGVAAESVRLVLQVPWQDLPLWFSNVVSGVLSTLWLATAVLLSYRSTPRRQLDQLSWVLSFFATFTLVAHGVFATFHGARLALLYVAAGAVVGFCLGRAWQGRRRVTGKYEQPAPPSHDPARALR